MRFRLPLVGQSLNMNKASVVVARGPTRLRVAVVAVPHDFAAVVHWECGWSESIRQRYPAKMLTICVDACDAGCVAGFVAPAIALNDDTRGPAGAWFCWGCSMAEWVSFDTGRRTVRRVVGAGYSWSRALIL